VIIGAYTADHNDKVDRLVLYAPVWLRTAPPPQAAPPPLGAYVAAPMATARQRLQAGAPDDRKNDLMPASWFDAWSAAALASDPVGSRQEPPVLRSPAGVVQDNRTYWTRQAILRPERIKVPTLVVVAEWDQVTPSQAAQALFHKLPSSPNKRLVEIGEGTHFVMLEKNRMQLSRRSTFPREGEGGRTDQRALTRRRNVGRCEPNAVWQRVCRRPTSS